MKSIILIQDLKGNILAVCSKRSKAFKKAMSLIGNNDAWITCEEAHYNKTIKATYDNMCERLNKYNKTSIDSTDLMLTIRTISVDE